jgi:hypothetical protein
MANFDNVAGAIIAATTSVVIDTIGQTGVYALFWGTYAGVTVNFEGTADGGATWVPLGAYQINANGVIGAINAILPTNGQQQFYILAGAAKQVRVRASAWTSGTCFTTLMAVQTADPILLSSAGTSAPAPLADGVANPSIGIAAADLSGFNGTTWDRFRNNNSAIAVDTSAARTVTGNGTTATNYNWSGAYIFINITAASGTTPTLVVRVQGSVDGTNFFDLDATNAVTASLTGISTAVIKVYPGITPAATAAANLPLPRVWRLAWVIGGTTPSFTFVTTASYIL